ncbi:MAG: thioredoxin family protein [Bacteroidota bacterium]|nr:thioredoxin family protein [Bacteroidota bacterium]
MLFKFNREKFAELLLVSDIPVLVNCTVPFDPVSRLSIDMIKELSKKNEDNILFMNVDLDEDESTVLIHKYNIRNAPLALLFYKGELIGRRIGCGNENCINPLLDYFIPNNKSVDELVQHEAS